MLHFNKIVNARLNAPYYAQNVKFVVNFHRIILLDSRISLTIMIQRTSVSLMVRWVENLQAISHRVSANRPLKRNIRLHSTRRFCKQLYDPAGTRRKNSRRASGDTQYHYLRIRTKSDKRQDVEKISRLSRTLQIDYVYVLVITVASMTTPATSCDVSNSPMPLFSTGNRTNIIGYRRPFYVVDIMTFLNLSGYF